MLRQVHTMDNRLWLRRLSPPQDLPSPTSLTTSYAIHCRLGRLSTIPYRPATGRLEAAIELLATQLQTTTASARHHHIPRARSLLPQKRSQLSSLVRLPSPLFVDRPSHCSFFHHHILISPPRHTIRSHRLLCYRLSSSNIYTRRCSVIIVVDITGAASNTIPID